MRPWQTTVSELISRLCTTIEGRLRAQKIIYYN